LKNRVLTRRTWLPIIILAIIGISSIAYLFPLILNGTEPVDNNNNNGDTNGENNNHIDVNRTDIKIVNKNTPPGYIMGNPLDMDLRTGMSPLFLDGSEEMISIRFTAQLSGEVSTLAIKAFATGEQNRILVGVQEDVSGQPNGKWISEDGFGTIDVPKQSKFLTINLQKSVSLSKERVYHIVIKATEVSVGNRIFISTYSANALAQPLNYEDPDIVWSDLMMNTLFYDGKDWKEEDKWPIFVVGYSDGRCEGQPYSLKAPWVIYKSTYVGQFIIPASDYSVGKIAFLVAKKNEASDRLYYEIRDQKNEVISTGLFATQDQITDRNSWVEVSLTSPVKMTAGKLYRIVLLSPGTEFENSYLLYGHEFSYNNSIGYGGLQHQITTSTSAGETWFENKDADAIFKITNAE
jgi:hypothetical protein